MGGRGGLDGFGNLSNKKITRVCLERINFDCFFPSRNEWNGSVRGGREVHHEPKKIDNQAWILMLKRLLDHVEVKHTA